MPTFTPIERTVKTIFGDQRVLEAHYGAQPTNDPRTTLNYKYQVQSGVLPTTYPTIKYAGIGIRGKRNVDDGFLTEPNEVVATNGDLYLPIPFRVVPVTQDLTPSERALYRMRQAITVGGSDYIAYWLKKLVFSASTVQFTRTDPITQVESEYAIDYSHMSPTPPTPSVNGVITDSASEINVSLAASFGVTGAEVVESVNVLYGGDLRYAVVSELGLYTGEDKVVQATGSDGVVFNYTESVFVQLAQHTTWNGVDFGNTSRSETFPLRFARQDVVLS